MSVNKVILIGRLGKDPEIRVTKTQKKVANFSVATSESYKDKTTREKIENTQWHNVVFWGPTADIVEKYLVKGKQVYIEGKLNTRSYDDKDGTTKYITEILGNQLTMLGDGGTGNVPYPPKAPQSQASTPVAKPVTQDVDDLPF